MKDSEPLKPPPPPAPTKDDAPPPSAPPDRLPPAAIDRLVTGARSGAAAGAREGQQGPSSWNLAYAPVIEIADDVVGTRAHHEYSIFARDSGLQGPRVTVRLAGDPALQLARAPMYLQGSAAYDPASAFMLDFVPKRAGLHEATLEVDILDEPRQHLTIPIRAWSRHAGDKTRAQTVVAEEQARTEESNREASAAARADAEARIARHDQQAVHHHHAGNLAQLDRKREDIEAKMLDLSGKRANGITLASGNIGVFKRQKPVPEQPSLLGQLAWSALDMVTGGVAKNVSSFLKAPLERLLATTTTESFPDAPFPIDPITKTTPHSAALVGLVIEGVRNGVKKIGGALQPGKPEHPDVDPDHVEGNNSLNAKDAFISAQTDAVTGDAHQIATSTSRFVFDSLLDTLDTAPKTALAVMDTMRDGLQAAFANAIEAQRAETFRNWIRYLTQTSVGTSAKRKADDGSGVTDIDRATTLGEDGAANTFDGIVDVEIEIQEGNPRAPAVPKSAKIRGVAQEVGKTLGRLPLLEARVPVRAVAGPSARSATSTLSVVRDEAGNLSYDDRVTGFELQPSRWLSRKAGIIPGSEGGQREGARILMEKEVMTTPLAGLLKTDSES